MEQELCTMHHHQLSYRQEYKENICLQGWILLSGGNKDEETWHFFLFTPGGMNISLMQGWILPLGGSMTIVSAGIALMRKLDIFFWFICRDEYYSEEEAWQFFQIHLQGWILQWGGSMALFLIYLKGWILYCPKVKTRKVLRGNILIFLITLVGERDIKRIYSLFMTFYCKMTC